MPFSYSHMLNLMLFLFAVVVAPVLFAQTIGPNSWLMPVVILQRTFVDRTPCFSQPRPGF